MATPKKSADSTTKKAPRTKTTEITTETAATGTARALEMSSASGNLEDRIRARAYELFQHRNGQNGSPESDWCQAEAEVLGTRQKRTA